MPTVAFLDANVLFPIYLADFFLTAYEDDLYRAVWSQEVLVELERNLRRVAEEKIGGNAADRVSERVKDMKDAFPEAIVKPPEDLVIKMTNNPKDRHVLAAAVVASADVIVTENTRDFSEEACAPHQIEVLTADEFAEDLVRRGPLQVWQVIETMAGRRKAPIVTPLEMWERLSHPLSTAMALLSELHPFPG